MQRVLLFLVTNFAILIVLSIAMQVLGIDDMLAASNSGFNTEGILAFSALFGFGGAFLSLAISKFMAKRAMGVRIIEQPSNDTERWIKSTVERFANQSNIGMPEVGIFDQPQPNAFATGMSRNNALVAVSTGLLHHMDRDEVEAVIGHEIAHVANGDMITMGLLQGVLNTFVIFLSRLGGFIVDRVILKNQRGHGIGYFVTTIVFQVLLSILASIITMWFSRRREFRADEGGAQLAGKSKMIRALKRLSQVSEPLDLEGEFAAFGISGRRTGLSALFLSHPPLEQRIRHLESQQIL
ncbi:MAG: protease HtpX [Gammaproteobacteria bacterium]|nr:protease HtpX [Gammaproteobacteria bacterium]